MISLTEENYLKALFALTDKEEAVSVNGLSKHLGIKMPTVTSMMKKLAEKNLVHYESYKPLRLTEEGKKQAGLIVRKHRLTEMFLVQQMGFGWEEVHEIAEEVEHIKSPAFFDKMDQLLGFPRVDPHGSPIPDKSGLMEWHHYHPLSEQPAGARITLRAVIDSSHDFLTFLNSRALSLGMQIQVLAVEAFDGSMVVKYGDKPAETLSRKVCDRLLVEQV
jgi:DtxR family transcriptional regulator, Mn-dependent transcriptional regulator